MKRTALLALLIFTAFAVNAQTVYTWVPAGGGVWTIPTNWSPNGELQQVMGCNNIKRLDAVFFGPNMAA